MTSQMDDFETRCTKTLDVFKRDLSRIRGGKASGALLEGVVVDYYGSTVPLNQLGNITAPEPRMITIQVYDNGAIESIEKAILQADLGLNPSTEGNVIRVMVPSLTEERRKEFIKKVGKMAEECRVSVRNSRRDRIGTLKKQQKDKDISEDEMHKGQDVVQKATDAHIKEIDALLASKEKEMMEV